MDQIKIGRFIAQCRKNRDLTQAQLAEQLNITDRAVSKWETGKSMPDSAILLDLCEILGITANELLSGEKLNMGNYEKRAEENLVALKRGEEKSRRRNVLLSILFSAALLVGLLVCLICDIALSGRLTWSLIPAGSILFAWLVFFSGIILGKGGLLGSLTSFSVFLVPYLYLLSRLTETEAVFTMGRALAVPSLLFLWLIALVLVQTGKNGKLAAVGFSCLLAIPFLFVINALLSKMVGTPLLDVWDLLSVLLLLTAALGAFLWEHVRKKR